MKLLLITGILLAGLGAFIVFRGLSYPSQRSVMKLGDFQASVEEQRVIPAWIGEVAMAGGLVLVVAGSRRRLTSAWN